AGNLTRKQNVFDDFIASAEYLIQAKYTNPARLAIVGGSNGGLLMGAALTQRPDLFRAVVSYVGIYDMLRTELDPNGVFNITEYGSVRDSEQFQVLYATGANDGRVNPYHSRKMTARLQAATSSSYPILLRTSARAGHGTGSRPQAIEQFTDTLAHLLDQLEMKQP